MAKYVDSEKETSKQIGTSKRGRTDINNKALLLGTTPTPFSTFSYYLLHDDEEAAKAQLTDDIEWDMMPNGEIFKGKEKVYSFVKAGWLAANKRAPDLINNVACKDWGVMEYWNIGTIDEGIVEFAKQSKWNFPGDSSSLVGRTYKVPVCFVYHITPEGKIDLMREYLDVGSVMIQLE